MRTVSSIALALACLAGCPKEPEPKPPDPPPEAPPPVPVDVVGAPATFTPLTPGAVCTYELKEVMTESLGEQLLAGHEITITYELRARQTEAPLTFEAEVTRIQADARRETYHAKLDSLRAGDLRRIQGGADTIVMYEMVVPFALLGKRLTIALDARGRIQTLEGGDAVRQAMLALHPPKPRKAPHYVKKVEVALSDDAILGYLLPSAVIVPKDGPLASGRQETMDDQTFDLADYAGRGQEGFRILLRPDRWLIEQKQAFIPVAEVHSVVPPLPHPLSEVTLEKGDHSVTVDFEPQNPCFKTAGSAFNDQAVWTGPIEDVKTTTERTRSITREWVKK